MEVPTNLVNAAIIFGAIATGISAIATAITAWFIYRTNEDDKKIQKAQMFIEISKKYDEIYHKRYKLWKTGRIWSKANEWYPEFLDLISSQEWSDLREVAACFELIGILVKKGYIDREVLFGFVRVNIPAVPHPGELHYGIMLKYF